MIYLCECPRFCFFFLNVQQAFYLSTFFRFSRSYWEILMMMTYATAFIFLPYDVAFYYGQRRFQSPFLSFVISFIGERGYYSLPVHAFRKLFLFVPDIVCLMDIAVNFRSSYQDHQSKRIVLETRKIASHYMRYYFWVDLFSSFPDRIIQTWVWKLLTYFFLIALVVNILNFVTLCRIYTNLVIRLEDLLEDIKQI